MPRGKELDPFIRTRICELYNTAKWGYKRIHNAYPQIPKSTIAYTIKKERERVNNQSQRRSGQPRKLTEDDRDRIYERFTTDPTARHEDLLAEVDYKIQRPALRYLLKEMGLQRDQ